MMAAKARQLADGRLEPSEAPPATFLLTLSAFIA